MAVVRRGALDVRDRRPGPISPRPRSHSLLLEVGIACDRRCRRRSVGLPLTPASGNGRTTRARLAGGGTTLASPSTISSRPTGTVAPISTPTAVHRLLESVTPPTGYPLGAPIAITLTYRNTGVACSDTRSRPTDVGAGVAVVRQRTRRPPNRTLTARRPEGVLKRSSIYHLSAFVGRNRQIPHLAC